MPAAPGRPRMTARSSGHAGIVSVQQGISVTEALIRLRAYAFGHDRLLADVAEDVVTHQLRLQ